MSRSSLKAVRREQTIADMTDALVDAKASKGFAETDDLVRLGRWSLDEIETYGPAAVARAGKADIRQTEEAA